MADRIALVLQNDQSMRRSIDLARYAEARGFETVWQSETRFVRDAIPAMAAYVSATRRLRVGCGVVNIYTRNVATLAAEMLTLDDLAPDRILCGLGTWSDDLAERVGVRRGRYLLAMREVVEALRRLFAMETVSMDGEFVQLRDVSLSGASSSREGRNVPIYVAATGPRMLALAGEIADGVLLNYMVRPEYNQMALEQIRLGAEKSGRRLADLDRPQLIACAVHRDRQRAVDIARPFVTQYIVRYPQLMRANGVSDALIDDLTQVLPPGSPNAWIAQAQLLVPDDIVRAVVACGTPEDVRRRVRAYVEAGATVPVLYSIGENVFELIDAFANGYRTR